MDEKPRMTPEEAAARFDALVVAHRRESRQRRPAGPRFLRMPPIGGAIAFSLVYLAGLGVGVVFHAKPIGAALITLPAMLIARALFGRRPPPGDDGS